MTKTLRLAGRGVLRGVAGGSLLLFLTITTAYAVDLMHNSADTGSTKWPQGWGVEGGKYGRFTCATCHEPYGENLKGIRRTIGTMNGDLWPNGQETVTVHFTNMTGQGDDYPGRSTSFRICEVCHSRTRFHNFDARANTEGYDHPTPRRVCTSCHFHNTGFKAACGGCHGNPPTTTEIGGDYGLVAPASNALAPGEAGAHQAHRDRNLVCDTCHFIADGGIRMPNLSHTIDIGFFGFGGKVTGGTYVPYSSPTTPYRFRGSAPGSIIAPAQVNHAEANRCVNVYCHGGGALPEGKPPLSGGSNTSPRWDGTSQNVCGSCHGSTPENAPDMGSHRKHSSSVDGYGYECDLCHPTIDMSHVQGSVRWALKRTDPRVGNSATYRGAASGATGELAPSATYGTCQSVTCHQDGRGGAPRRDPVWGDGEYNRECNGCHGGNGSSSGAISTGRHIQHIDQPALNGVSYGCVECHAKTVSADRTIAVRENHLNGFVDFSGAKGGKNPAACNSAYCHSDGKGGSGIPVSWSGGTVIDSCTGCHGAAQTPAFASLAGEPNYENEGGGSLRANSHLSHTRNLVRTGAASCSICHVNTVTPTGGAIRAGAPHLDQSIDVSFDTSIAGGGASWSPATKSCNSVQCHGGAPIRWGDAGGAGCTACHPILSGAHSRHVGDLFSSGAVTFYNFTANRSSGSVYRFGCATCHPTDVGRHRNGAVDLTFNRFKRDAGSLTLLNTLVDGDGVGYSQSAGTSVTCSLVYCHSTGRSPGSQGAAEYRISPDWYGGSFPPNRCGGCHDNPPRYAGQSHYVESSSTGDDGRGGPYAETAHLIGIHPLSTYAGNNQNGYLGYSSSGSVAHGNPAVATTLACYVCHSGVVSSTRIDTHALEGTGSRFRCGRCHSSSGRTPLQSGEIVGASLHVNGVKDVIFAPVTFRTKAQLANVANALGWSRTGDYKFPDSHDSFNLSLSTWDPLTKSCLTACHVNQAGIVWGGQLTCASCHANQ